MKIFLSILSALIGTAAFFPYLRDIFLRKTKPHAYTWLIWMITQGVAVAGIWYGRGGLGGLNLVVGLFLVASVFLFSLRYGTRNITAADNIVFGAALFAVVIWWNLHQPRLAILVVSAIDLLGYAPSFRKSYAEPWSETLISWGAFAMSDILALFALDRYNVLTMTYLAAIAAANSAFLIFCIVRRRGVPRPPSR